MDIKSVIKHIIDHTKTDGGCSMNIEGSTPSYKGYMVGISEHQTVVPVLTEKVLIEFIADNWNQLRQTWADIFIGTWVDNGQIYLDVSQQYFVKKWAFAAARMFNQLAVYNLTTGESIPVPAEEPEPAGR